MKCGRIVQSILMHACMHNFGSKVSFKKKIHRFKRLSSLQIYLGIKCLMEKEK